MPNSDESTVPDSAAWDEDEVSRLGMIVGQEAQRVLSGKQFQPDPELVARGWERRFMADGRRAQEAIELYTEMGYEVLSVPVDAGTFDDDCDDCALLAAFQFQTIYVRKKQPE